MLLEAYFTEFTASDNVQLVLKTFPNPHNDVAAQIEAWRTKSPNPPECVHIDRDLATDSIDQLYAEADCLAYPTRAEGFGLPIAEAMACRIPVIVTGYSGHMDFCSDDTAFLVDYILVPSRSHLAVPGAQWAEPKIDHLRKQMRHVFSHRNSEDVNRRVEAAYQNIKTNVRWSVVADRVQKLPPRRSCKPVPKLAMVTTLGLPLRYR